jgi:two-component system NtrC family sensor kinase
MKSMKSTVKRTDEEELLKIMGDEAPMGVCIMQDGKFCCFNSNFPVATGYTADELMGKDSLEIVAPEDREMVKENTIKMLKGKLTSPYQFKVIHKDGSIVWIMATVKSIRYQGRRATLGSYMEITERGRMEEALKENEENYRELANSITDVFFAMDEHLRYTYWNKASEILTGIRAGDAIGKSLREIFPDTPGIRKAEKVYRNVLKTQQSQTFVSGVNFGGKHYIFEISAYPSRGGISVFVKDITERRQAEERLKESEQKYRLLFETSLDCIAQIDREGKVLAANPAAARSLGVPLEELIGKTFFEVMPQEVAQLRLEQVRKVLDEWQPQIFEDERAGRYFHHIDIPTKTSDQKEAVQVITRDITERREMEEALRQSEENYKTLFNSSVVGMYVLDIETMKIVMGNRAAQEMVGISSAEEGIGINPFDFVVPEDREKVIEIAVSEFLQDSRRTHEVQVVDKNGQRGWQSFSIARITHQGKLASLVSISNITERKQAEEALRRSEERYRTTLEEMEDSYFEVDLAGNLTFVNNSVCRDLGYSMEELIGMSYKGFTAEDDIESVFRVFNEVYRTGVPNKGFPWKTTRKDGSHGFAETSISLLRNNKGEVTGFRGVGRDVTERKQSEEKLRQSEENYKTLFDSSVIGMYVLDAETFKVVMGNRVAAEMAGFSSAGEGVGINPLDFVIPEDREQVLEMAVKEFEQDLRRTHEVRVIAKDGGIGWISISSTRIMHEGKLASLVSISNITERKRMEEVLRQSEENYRALFDSSVIGTFVIDAETMKIVIGNRAAAKMFGFSSVEEGIGVNPLDFVHPEDRERYLEIARKELFEQDLRRTQEWQAITKDGREIWVSITGARIMHEGRLAALVSFIDITERKQTEEKLRQSKENYRALFDSAVIGALVVDAETMKVVMANEATMKMFGFSSPEDGVNPFDFIPPEDRQKNLERIVVEVFGKDSRKSIDLPAVTKDGKKIWVSMTGARIMHNGKLAGLFSFTDITERKQAEEALRQSEENYRALFDSSVIGTVLLDAETMKVVMVNQAALKMFGFSSAGEAFEAKPFDFILPEDKEKYFEITKTAVLKQNSHEGYQLRAVTKDGREIWINTTATMVTHRGKLAALISFADITEQKKQSERLMMTDRLASLGELASGTAHELNNPLTSIIGFSQLLMEREVPDDIREDLKLINNEAQRAASVTKNLLTFARKHAPVKQRNQINNIIEDVLKLRTYEHKVNAIEVERQLDPNIPETMVDYFQMQQVFMNIIINAEYFMTAAHNRGTLIITTKKQTDTVMISFADDGPGIPPENLKRIFDPFFTTKEAGKGTGLGLSICHGIVTEHGGQIYARSQPGKGATIFVELPLNNL